MKLHGSNVRLRKESNTRKLRVVACRPELVPADASALQSEASTSTFDHDTLKVPKETVGWKGTNFANHRSVRRRASFGAVERPLEVTGLDDPYLMSFLCTRRPRPIHPSIPSYHPSIPIHTLINSRLFIHYSDPYAHQSQSIRSLSSIYLITICSNCSPTLAEETSNMSGSLSAIAGRLPTLAVVCHPWPEHFPTGPCQISTRSRIERLGSFESGTLVRSPVP